MSTVRFIFIAGLLLSACNHVRAPAPSFYEVSGSQAERVNAVTEIISKSQPLPTPLMDAYFVEEKMGDGELGPADYRSFYRLEVAPEDVGAWQALLSPLTGIPDYPAPMQPASWWVDEESFSLLQFYAPDTLTSRTHGWIAISPENGHIFIFTYTT
ncbi:MAG: hypothetical protein IT328_27060 [Caldilineaceae bacterium]|nr:hypothetical protein [Caldilineaceae bacterium]